MPKPTASTNYNDVRSKAGRLYQPTRFEFHIPELPLLIHRSLGANEFRRDFQFSLENVFFPGRNISSEPIKIAGPVDEIPYEATYSGDLDMTVRVSGDFKEKNVFETWQDIIINQRTQNLNYPDNYRCRAIIEALNLQNEKIYEIALTEVWPKSVGRISVGQGLFNSVATMQIQLAFRRYYVTYSDDIRTIGDPVNTGTRSTTNADFMSDKINSSINQGADFPSPIKVQETFEELEDTTSEYNMGSGFNPDFITNAEG